MTLLLLTVCQSALQADLDIVLSTRSEARIMSHYDVSDVVTDSVLSIRSEATMMGLCKVSDVIS